MKDATVWEYPKLRVEGEHDLSGAMMIRNSQGHTINVDGESLKAFIADFIRDQRIGKLEAASTEEIIDQ